MHWRAILYFGVGAIAVIGGIAKIAQGDVLWGIDKLVMGALFVILFLTQEVGDGFLEELRRPDA